MLLLEKLRVWQFKFFSLIHSTKCEKEKKKIYLILKEVTGNFCQFCKIVRKSMYMFSSFEKMGLRTTVKDLYYHRLCYGHLIVFFILKVMLPTTQFVRSHKWVQITTRIKILKNFGKIYNWYQNSCTFHLIWYFCTFCFNLCGLFCRESFSYYIS